MSLFISSLNSGSNGNCYYVGNGREAVLIDAGISCREIEKRMKRSGLEMDKLKAIFVSHEHVDHISGITTLVKKYQLPVYITSKTFVAAGISVPRQYIQPIRAQHPIEIGSLSITAFPKNHDAVDPLSFVVSSEEVNIGVFTDIGSACKHVIKYFGRCHAAFLETNYDEEMLDNGSYPAHLKARIRSDEGHLSNKQAFELFLNHKAPFLKLLLLSHLSAENNRPTLAKSIFKSGLHGVDIKMTYRDKETAVYFVNSQQSVSRGAAPQLSLF
jgi:phosphoribosyl 1,2-cyclic phosphodiesterase